MREGAGPKISRSAKITQATAVHGPGTLEQQVNGERRHLRQVRYRGRCVHSCSSGGCLMTPDSHNSDPPSHSGRPRAPQQPMPLHQVRRCIRGAHLYPHTAWRGGGGRDSEAEPRRRWSDRREFERGFGLLRVAGVVHTYLQVRGPGFRPHVICAIIHGWRASNPTKLHKNVKRLAPHQQLSSGSKLHCCLPFRRQPDGICDWWIPQTATTTQDSLVQVLHSPLQWPQQSNARWHRCNLALGRLDRGAEDLPAVCFPGLKSSLVFVT